MMTDDDLQKLESTIATLETEIADLTRANQEFIDRAREFNAKGREAIGKRTSLHAMLDTARKSLRQEHESRSIAAKQKANEEAAALAKQRQEDAEAEAKAKADRETNEIDRLREENERLRDELAAK